MNMVQHAYLDHPLRQQLVTTALQWEQVFGVMPRVTSEVSEFDAAMLVGHTPESFGQEMQGATAVQKGFDFRHQGIRYQVKANRPSGKPGSKVTRVSKPENYDWDTLIWVLYNEKFEIQESWVWPVAGYKDQFDAQVRLGPEDMRLGVSLA